MLSMDIENISKNSYKWYIYNIKLARNNISILKKFTKKSEISKISISNYLLFIY